MEETAIGKWGHDLRCCLDNKRRICAQNKGGEAEDLGVTMPEQHSAVSQLEMTKIQYMTINDQRRTESQIAYY